MSKIATGAWAAALAALAACAPADSPRAAEAGSTSDPRPAVPGVVVDSAIPIPEAVRRFQESTEQTAPAALSGGAASLDELLRRLVRAYTERDADELDQLAITRAEFAYLYYPESPYPEPPYQLAPDFLWYLIEQNGSRTVSRAVERLGGREARMEEHRCPAGFRLEGATRVWGPCFVSVRYEDGKTEELRIVNAVAERDGRFKLISFDGKL